MNNSLSRLIGQKRIAGPLLFLAVFGVLGVGLIFQSRAATVTPTDASAGSMYLTPNQQQLAVGDDLTVSVWADSQSGMADNVQAVLTYPADKLEYTSSDATGSAFTSEDAAEATAGTLRLQRHSNGGLTGKQLVSTVTFRTKASGDATVTISNDSTLLSTTSHSNMLATRTPGLFTIK